MCRKTPSFRAEMQGANGVAVSTLTYRGELLLMYRLIIEI